MAARSLPTAAASALAWFMIAPSPFVRLGVRVGLTLRRDLRLLKGHPSFLQVLAGRRFREILQKHVGHLIDYSGVYDKEIT